MVSIGLKRGLVALGFALALIVSACGSSSSTSNPAGLPGNGGGGNGGGGSSLTAGLESNLDQLTSYQFSWTVFGASSGVQGSPGSSGSYATAGTVVNKPTKAMAVNSFGIQYIQVGAQEWMSLDGNTWNTTDGSTDLTSMLPMKYYTTWFDTNSTGFKVAGNETKNGVPCVHYKGDSSLSGLYQGIAGVLGHLPGRPVGGHERQLSSQRRLRVLGLGQRASRQLRLHVRHHQDQRPVQSDRTAHERGRHPDLIDRVTIEERTPAKRPGF